MTCSAASSTGRSDSKPCAAGPDVICIDDSDDDGGSALLHPPSVVGSSSSSPHVPPSYPVFHGGGGLAVGCASTVGFNYQHPPKRCPNDYDGYHHALYGKKAKVGGDNARLGMHSIVPIILP